MSINDYVLKIKALIDLLASIGSLIDNDDKVVFCLNGLRENDKWKSFITSVYVRDCMPEFDELVALMVIEEMNLQGSTSSSNQSQVFYVGNRGTCRYNRSRGRGGSFSSQFQKQSNENIRGRRGGSTKLKVVDMEQ